MQAGQSKALIFLFLLSGRCLATPGKQGNIIHDGSLGMQTLYLRKSLSASLSQLLLLSTTWNGMDCPLGSAVPAVSPPACAPLACEGGEEHQGPGFCASTDQK